MGVQFCVQMGLLLHHPPSTILSCQADYFQNADEFRFLSAESPIVGPTVCPPSLHSKRKTNIPHLFHAVTIHHSGLLPVPPSCSCQGSWASWKISLAKSSGGQVWHGRKDSARKIHKNGLWHMFHKSIAILLHVSKKLLLAHAII